MELAERPAAVRAAARLDGRSLTQDEYNHVIVATTNLMQIGVEAKMPWNWQSTQRSRLGLKLEARVAETKCSEYAAAHLTENQHMKHSVCYLAPQVVAPRRNGWSTRMGRKEHRLAHQVDWL